MRKLQSTDFPMRMNIHFCIDEKSHDKIKTLNQTLVGLGSQIDFSKKHIPHITILMGTIPTINAYKRIVNSLVRLKHQINIQTIHVSKPYTVPPKHRFVFMDTSHGYKLKEIKYTIFNDIKDCIELEYHGGPETDTHLTLGYFESLDQNVKSVIDKMILNDSKLELSEIGISPASDRGTCLKEIFTVNLG